MNRLLPARKQVLLVLKRQRVCNDENVSYLSLVEDGCVDLWPQLYLRATSLVARVDPDLDDSDPLGRLGPHDISSLGRGRHVMDAPESLIVREPGIRATARCADTGRHEIPCATDLSDPLLTPHLQRDLFPVASGGNDRAHTVVRVTIQVVDEVVTREVLGSPTGVFLPAKMCMRVDESRHHRPTRQVHHRRAGRHIQFTRSSAHGGDDVTLHNKSGVLDDSTVAHDQTGTGKHSRAGFGGTGCGGIGFGGTRLARRNTRPAGRGHEQGEQPQMHGPVPSFRLQ